MKEYPEYPKPLAKCDACCKGGLYVGMNLKTLCDEHRNELAVYLQGT